MRQREANLTALAAIGPRKKRKLEDTAVSIVEVFFSSYFVFTMMYFGPITLNALSNNFRFSLRHLNNLRH